MKVLIAGAGIGGLAAAVALRREGHDVHVVERAAGLTEVGAGVGLQPHAMRCLDHLGVTERLAHISYPEKISFKDMIEGRQLYESTLGAMGEKLYGAPSAVVHRRDLIDALAAQLPAECLHLDSEIVAAAQDGPGVELKLKDGSVLGGEILVGADGLRSTVRSAFFGEMPRLFTGYLAWRTVVPAEQFQGTFANQISIWLGAGRHVISYPIRKGEQVYAGCYVPADEALLEDWSKSGDVAELRKAFADACPELREVIAGVDKAFITGIFYRAPLDTWRNGRVVLLGDAAHPVLPTSGSGAGLALEDAVCLAACLGRNELNPEGAFEEFEIRRKPRTSRVLATSRADLRAFHEDDEYRRGLRMRIDAGMNRVDPTGWKRHSWLYCHDEVAESAKPLERYLQEHGNPLRRPDARRAFDLWKSAVQPEDLANGWAAERNAFEKFTEGLSSMPPGVRCEEVDCGGVAAVRVLSEGGDHGPAFVHLPGNGFTLGDNAASVPLAARLAAAVGGWTLVPRLRTAPEHGAAALLEDVARAYDWAAGRAGSCFLSGEGSGANLALRLVQRRGGLQRLVALYLLSPFLDLTLSSESVARNSTMDPWLHLQRLLFLSAACTQGADPAAPEFSPIRGDLGDVPPTLIFAAEGESLADDARALATALSAARSEARLTLVPDSVHSFALFDFLPESETFVRTVAEDSLMRLQRAGAAGSADVRRSYQ